MYLHAGNDKIIRTKSIIGFFDMEQKCGRLESSKDEIPKSFILYEKDGACKVCISQLSTLSLCTRAKKSEM